MFSFLFGKTEFNKYGWKRDLPDQRDFKYTAIKRSLPKQVDLRPILPPVRDQKDLGACTSFATASAFEYDLHTQKVADFTPAPLYIYYNTRILEGTVKFDSGATIRNSIKSIAKYGACRESYWRYLVSRAFKKPSKQAYTHGYKHKAIKYYAVEQTLGSICSALAAGKPIVFGISVYSSFEEVEPTATGVIPMPKVTDDFLGGHAILICGFNSEKRLFTFRNSWGKEWGDNGYGYLPYEYVLNPDLAGDFWVVDTVVG